MLQKDFRAVNECFYDNYMVLNPRKCHYVCLGRSSNNDTFVYDYLCRENGNEELALGTPIDRHLIAIQKYKLVKVFILSRVSNYLKSNRKKHIFNGMIKAHVSCCALIWMEETRTI